MRTCTIRVSLLLTVIVLLLRPVIVHADLLDKVDDLDKRQAINNCLTLIEARRINKGTAQGAFRMATNADAVSIWIEQYFTLEAMLALLTVTDDPNSKYVKWVGEYLEFYAKDAVKEPQGVAHNFEGPINHPLLIPSDERRKDYDSIDSYAGLFLLVSSRYYKITGKLSPEVSQAALTSLSALNRVINDKKGVSQDGGQNWDFPNKASSNGLPIARADYPHHQLMDAVEAYAGLRESVDLFQKIDKPDAAKQAELLANGVAKGVELFKPESREGLYIYPYLLDNGNQPLYASNGYPGILANLFAVSYFSSTDSTQREKVWQSILTKIDAPDVPTERWLIAAARVASDTGATSDKEAVIKFQSKVIANTKSFGSGTYLERLAISILALMEPSGGTLSRVQLAARMMSFNSIRVSIR